MIIVERHLAEINTLADFNNDDVITTRMATQYGDDLKQAKKVGEIGDLTVFEAPNNVFYLAKEKMDPLGRVALNTTRFDGFHYVRHVWINPEIRGRGLGYALYIFLLKKGFKIISDFDQTTQAKQVWAKLAERGYVHRMSIDGDIGPVVHKIEAFYTQPDEQPIRERLVASLH